MKPIYGVFANGLLRMVLNCPEDAEHEAHCLAVHGTPAYAAPVEWVSGKWREL